MDNAAKLVLTGAVAPPTLLENIGKTDGISEESKKQVAKDFESVFINKLLDEMNNTIGDWGFEEDGASMQVQGIFWLYLGRDIANNGGLGLWKDIYQFLNGSEQTNTKVETLDSKL